MVRLPYSIKIRPQQQEVLFDVRKLTSRHAVFLSESLFVSSDVGIFFTSVFTFFQVHYIQARKRKKLEKEITEARPKMVL